MLSDSYYGRKGKGGGMLGHWGVAVHLQDVHVVGEAVE